MKGLWKYIPPFAPDQSGAAAVLCELGGLMVVIDAGGCAGNICGFDEPRWFLERSAIFSAGLRDMDAILGRDERLVEKTKMACEQIKSNFVALIGTPVPAVIGTDYLALKRMIKKRTGLLVIAVDSTGTGHYDKGASKAYLELVKTIAKEEKQKQGPEKQPRPENGENPKKVYLGATPLDTDGKKREGFYGMDKEKRDFKSVLLAEEVSVLAPCGLAAARWLEAHRKIPYTVGYPVEDLDGYPEFCEKIKEWKGKKILIVHQQILANTLREIICRTTDSKVTVASWFLMDQELEQEGDISLKEEEQWILLVKEGNYDVIIGDPLFQKAIRNYGGEYISLPHFAVSGTLLNLKGFAKENRAKEDCAEEGRVKENCVKKDCAKEDCAIESVAKESCTKEDCTKKGADAR